jgi:hypothetical protein
MTRPAAPQRDLFGRPPPPRRDETPVSIPMREVSAGTRDAWHLTPAGRQSDLAKFAPRSLVTRGEGVSASMFTMPRWIASERGWL